MKNFNTKISESLVFMINNIMASNSLGIPDDWILIFEAGYSNGKIPLVAKNKLGSYPSDKM